MEFFYFMIFALILVGMYIAIRRQMAEPAVIAALGIFGSIISMVLFMLARDASVVQAIIMSIFVGTLFAGSTLAIAWYFQSNEIRQQYTFNHEDYEEE